MNHDVYLIWWKTSHNSVERAAGFAYTWTHAKAMAESLFAIKKKIDKQDNVIVGCSLIECGNLYTSQAPKQKWQIFPVLAVLTSSSMKEKVEKKL